MSQPGHIKSLDGVRAIAILLVVVFHAGLGNYGWVGVQLFFVLSGFLITGILWKERATATTLGYKFKKFWTRRALRIFPLYFGYLLALGAVYVVFHFPPYYRRFIPYLLTYTFNYTRSLHLWMDNPLFTQLWSLCVEEQFYIFFPFVIFLCPPRFTARLMVVIVFLAPVIRWALCRYYLAGGASDLTAGDATYRNTLSHLDAFFMGGLIPVLGLDKRVTRPLLLFLCALLLAFGFGAWNYLHSPRVFAFVFELGYPQMSDRNGFHIWGYTCLDLLFAASLLLVVSAHRPAFMERVNRVLSSWWFVRIGRVSYGMYIFNLAVWMYFFEPYFRGAGIPVLMALFVPYLLIVWGLAELSYWAFESRFIRLKDKVFPGGGAAEIRASLTLKPADA
ncbi:acyltransferase family protein [Dinghuibacter silviterrae]|uniref:Peptidoglycan/LPS O-acetylase OafA/YrhL n=1 Tax=Dinghuibacter silviterrae TaxID=1539049 RepID=A0A4R8DXF7_9BACT|nr:acyltransferase [Dinghuibacter silviterrae]TDX01901.1 peptidoglycan/LPS O-acetylase OafA/YrhL [Dinghuibacter silviterrae]